LSFGRQAGRINIKQKGDTVMSKSLIVVLAAVCVLLTAGSDNSWSGPKWEIGNSNTWMQAGFLGQIHFSMLDGAADEDDVYLRRARIILSGQITDGVMFFAETDNDNAGKSGQTAVSTDIQDVFADVRLIKHDEESAHWLKAGLILLPFSFENRSGAGSPLGIDYNAEAIKLVNTFAWRDYGAELHGNMGKWVSYAAGVFDGYDVKDSDKNPGSALRFTGHMAINPVGKAESDWFYSQERLGKKGDYLSLGAGVDMQDKATLTVTSATNGVAETRVENDSNNWVVDLQAGQAVKMMLFTLNAAYYDWDNSAFKGDTAFVEGGAMYENTQLTMKYTVQDPDGKDSTADYTVGIHHYLKGHNARGGVEYRWGDSADMILAGIHFLL
jgi:hypothetical protein